MYRHTKCWRLGGFKVHSFNSHFLAEGWRHKKRQVLVQIHTTSTGNSNLNFRCWAPVWHYLFYLPKKLVRLIQIKLEDFFLSKNRRNMGAWAKSALRKNVCPPWIQFTTLWYKAKQRSQLLQVHLDTFWASFLLLCYLGTLIFLMFSKVTVQIPMSGLWCHSDSHRMGNHAYYDRFQT